MVTSTDKRNPETPTEAPPSPPPPPPAPPRRSSLHDFPLPLPSWSYHRLYRCASVNRFGEIIGSTSSSPTSHPIKIQDDDDNDDDDDDDAFENVRAKLLVHLQKASDRVDLATASATAPPPKEVVPEPERPAWKLRNRRPPVPRDASLSPPRHLQHPPTQRTVRLRSESAEKKEERRPRFSLTLSAREIDEDFYSLTGARARRRPKRRPKPIQRQIDNIYPGSWMTEVYEERYKVPE